MGPESGAGQGVVRSEGLRHVGWGWVWRGAMIAMEMDELSLF